MARFQIYAILEPRAYTPYSGGNFTNKPIWRVTEEDRNLIQWLEDNIGRTHYCNYQIPMTGEGWQIREGYSEDKDLADFDWRRLNPYTPKGKYGYWLEIYDDDKAVLLKLSGILDNRPRGPARSPLSLDYEPPNE